MLSEGYKCVRHYNFDETNKLAEYKIEGGVSMDKYDFMNMLQEIFEKCKTEDEINKRTEELIFRVKDQAKMAKYYLKSGIL